MKMETGEIISRMLTLVLLVASGPTVISWAWTGGSEGVAIDGLALAQVPQVFQNGPLVSSNPSSALRQVSKRNVPLPNVQARKIVRTLTDNFPRTDEIIKIMNDSAKTWDSIWRMYSETSTEEKINTTYINNVFWEKLLTKIQHVHFEIRKMDRQILSERKPLALMDAIFEITNIKQLTDLKEKHYLNDREHLTVTYFQLSSASSQYHRLYTKRIRDILSDDPRLGLIADSVRFYRNFLWKGDKFENVTIRQTTDLTDKHMLYGPDAKNIWVGIKNLLEENPEIFIKAQFEENKMCNATETTFTIEPAGMEGPYYVLFHLCLTDIKEYVLISFAKFYDQIFRGHAYTNQDDLKQRMFRRCHRKVDLFNEAFGNDRTAQGTYFSHPGIASCNPNGTWEYGVDYIKLTNFIKIFVAPEESLHKSGSCRSTCSVFDSSYTPCAEDDTLCKINEERECALQPEKCRDYDPVCPTNNFYCENGTTSVTVCPSQRPDRLYEAYYGEGFQNGNISQCEGNEITYTGHWELEQDTLGATPHFCEVCTCYCFEPMPKLLGNHTVRYFNTALMKTNTKENYILVGARFVQIDDQIGIAIAEAKALPNGKFDTNTTRWIHPTKQTKIADPDNNIKDGAIKLDQDVRAFNLDDIVADMPNRVVTGLQFYSGYYEGDFYYKYLGLGIVTHEIDDMGVIRNYLTEEEKTGSESTRFGRSGGKLHKNDNSTVSRAERKLPAEPNGPDDPVKATKQNTPNSRTNEYIVFKGSSIYKDAAQSTVPYLDSQPLVMPVNDPHWLKGLGVFHKTVKGYGGFLALKLIPHKGND